MNSKAFIFGIASLLLTGSVIGKDVDPEFLEPSHIKLSQYWGDALAKKYRFTAKDAPVRTVVQMIVTRAKIAAHIYPTPDKTVTLDGSEMTLRDVFWEIKQQTGCNFSLLDAYLVIGTKGD